MIRGTRDRLEDIGILGIAYDVSSMTINSTYLKSSLSLWTIHVFIRVAYGLKMTRINAICETYCAASQLLQPNRIVKYVCPRH